jgi:hypothetical protein
VVATWIDVQVRTIAVPRMHPQRNLSNPSATIP